MGRNIEDIKHFLLMPIECTTETNRVFVYKGRIYSSQMYRGMDPDIGSIVKHVAYGRGKVKEVSGDHIVIAFDSSEIKTFSLDMCIKKKYLERIR